MLAEFVMEVIGEPLTRNAVNLTYKKGERTLAIQVSDWVILTMILVGVWLIRAA